MDLKQENTSIGVRVKEKTIYVCAFSNRTAATEMDEQSNLPLAYDLTSLKKNVLKHLSTRNLHLFWLIFNFPYYGNGE